MRILAIDPGNTHSAYMVLENGCISSFDKLDNAAMLGILDTECCNGTLLACEMIASYGMAVGASVFETCVWIGRFIERWDGDYKLIKRIEVKSHICHSGKAKDANIRQALIDRYGEPGKKSDPGPTFGISADVWAALAVATVAWDRYGAKEAA